MTLTFNLATTLSLSRSYMIEQIMQSQPKIVWQTRLAPQIEKIASYIAETIKKIQYLQVRAPEKLDAHIVKIVTVAVFGAITLSLFFTAISALLKTLAGDPVYLFECVISFLVSYSGGLATLTLARNLDGAVRYDVMIDSHQQSIHLV